MGHVDIIGWDIGGANMKATKVTFSDKGDIINADSLTRYFEMWNYREELSSILENLYRELGKADYMGVTMTGELADTFYNRKQGVEFIGRTVREQFGEIPLYFLLNNGTYITFDEIKKNYREVAAANWVGSGMIFSDYYSDIIFCDIGSTTTDIIPIIDGQLETNGRTDVERLETGELLYLGSLRTNLSSLVNILPYRNFRVRVMREYFATTADLHLYLGYIDRQDYLIPAPDNRGKTKKDCANRIARLIGLDYESITERELEIITEYIFNQELSLIKDGLFQVFSGKKSDFSKPVLATGSGSFLIDNLCQRMGLKMIDRSDIPELLKNNISTSLGTAFGLYNMVMRNE